MISLAIKDIKQFMSKLLVKDTFDKLLLSEASIVTGNTFFINGEINKSFYTEEEFANLLDKKYSVWASLKPFCFSVIKGNRVPSSLKIIFVLPESSVLQIISDNSSDYELSDINGLFLNIRYQEGALSIVTGTSIRKFTLDKSLDNAFDQYVRKFLSDNEIGFEEL